MKITKIEPQKRHKNRMSVFLDGAFAFGIDEFSLYSLKLKEGMELTDAALLHIKATVVKEDAKNYAAKLLSSRSYTTRDMLKKLTDRTGDEDISYEVIQFLKEYKLLDDYDYALRFAKDCVNLKKLGKQMVKVKMVQKGLDRETIDNVLEELDFYDQQQENLKILALKKLGGDFELKNVMKTKRYLATKGYGFDEIDSVIRALKQEHEEEGLC